jgi:hypothetical protein
MNLEQLEKGNQIVKEIEKCKANIKASNYTQLEGVVVRKTYLKVNGLDESIEVPENLFRIIGKLIISEYEQKLFKLENELKSL